VLDELPLVVRQRAQSSARFFDRLALGRLARVVVGVVLLRLGDCATQDPIVEAGRAPTTFRLPFNRGNVARERRRKRSRRRCKALAEKLVDEVPRGSFSLIWLLAANDVLLEKLARLPLVLSIVDVQRFETAHRILGDREIERGGPEGRVFVVHRLDRDTSGVVLFAKTEEAKRRLQINWEKVEKHYVAVVDGVPAEPEGRLTHWLREDVSGLRVNVVEPGHPYGYKSITSYAVTATGEGRAILAVKAETGRKHQIRAQLSTMGTPVCGDVRYGSPRKASRLALHAAKLTFPHPGTGEIVTLEAPVPPKLLSMIKKPRPQRPRPRRK